MKYSMKDRILLYMHAFDEHNELHVCKTDKIWDHMIESNGLNPGYKEVQFSFNEALWHLKESGYINQVHIDVWSLTAKGKDRIEELLHPPFNPARVGIIQGNIQLVFGCISLVIALISIFMAIPGGIGVLLDARSKGESRAFSVKSHILLTGGLDRGKNPVNTIVLNSLVQQPPAGVIFNGIPYHLSGESPVIETESQTSRNPNAVIIPVDIPSPLRVHVLINLSYGSMRYTEGRDFSGLDICNITLYTARVKKTYPLKAGVDLREWVISSSGVINSVGDHVRPVWRGSHFPSGQEVVIDHIMLQLPEDWKDDRLRYIEIEDRSQEFLSTIDPGILVFGITVEHQN